MSPFDRRLLSNLNVSLFFLVLVLFALGVLNLYSASSLRLQTGITTVFYYKKQFVWGGLGLLVMLASMVFDYRHLKSISRPLYLFSLMLLVWVLCFSEEIFGARRWISLGGFSLQPTEIAKLSVLIMAAHSISRLQGRIDWGDLWKLLLLVLVPAGLIILQPDLGSGLNLLLIMASMLLYKGLEKKVFRTLFLALPLTLPWGWFFLKGYQKQRILTFLHPEQDPLGAGYNIIQSKIAIGSGGAWGKGFLEGTQSQLMFLPEKHTDFALAVFGEEWGFFGCLTLLTLFCLFLYQILCVVEDSKDSFGHYLVCGIFFYFFWQILINMGMVLGLMPIVGIPLPFLSYGGTSTVINFCLLGLVLNVSMRRFVFRQY